MSTVAASSECPSALVSAEVVLAAARKVLGAGVEILYDGADLTEEGFEEARVKEPGLTRGEYFREDDRVRGSWSRSAVVPDDFGPILIAGVEYESVEDVGRQIELGAEACRERGTTRVDIWERVDPRRVLDHAFVFDVGGPEATWRDGVTIVLAAGAALYSIVCVTRGDIVGEGREAILELAMRQAEGIRAALEGSALGVLEGGEGRRVSVGLPRGSSMLLSRWTTNMPKWGVNRRSRETTPRRRRDT